MKQIFSVILSGTLTVAACSAAAQESDYAGMDAVTVAQKQKAPSHVPGDAVLAAIERRNWSGNHYTDNLVYPGSQIPMGKRDGTLGFLSYVTFRGGHPLFQCFVTGDRFTSVQENCEGGNKPTDRAIIGYIASTQLPGTVPLYRCLRNVPGNYNHFDSLDANCEGVRSVIREGVLGYVWL